MIQRDLVLTINNNTASLNEPLVIYQRDRGITLKIKIMKYKFIFNKITEEDVVADTSIISARAIVLKPDGKKVFECPRQAVEDDCVIIPITLDWTDEELEVGKYQLQIQLYGHDYISERVTLPPFEFTVAKTIGYVKEEGLELIAYADSAIVNLNELTDELSGVEVEDGDLTVGVYDKTVWEPGDIITSDELNKFEDAVEYLVRTQQVKAIYTPSVNEAGDLSWTNDLALENPETVNIRGPQGEKGDKGVDGTVAFEELTDEQRKSLRGENGTSIMEFSGEVEVITDLENLTDLQNGSAYLCKEDGNMYVWDGLEFVNCGDIKGPQGEQGPQGPKGDALTYEDLTTEQKAELTQGFITCNEKITRIEVVEEYPENEELGVLYIKVSGE